MEEVLKLLSCPLPDRWPPALENASARDASLPKGLGDGAGYGKNRQQTQWDFEGKG
jgi:hypothetical protein